MNNKKSQPLLVAIVLPLALLAGKAGADALIYEDFDYNPGSLSGGTGGTGFAGNWITKNEAPMVFPGLSWGLLPVKGNSVTSVDGGSAARAIGATSVLDTAGLMGNGQTLWFSVVVNKPTANNANIDWNFSLGTDAFHQFTTGGGSTYAERMNLESGEGIGFAVTNRSPSLMDVEGAYWKDDDDADTRANRVVRNTDATDAIKRWSGGTVLIVGRIDWGADDLANETLTLYAPDTSLNLGPALSTWNTIPAMDQSAFDVVAFQLKGGGTIDEIRFGATYADVITSLGQ